MASRGFRISAFFLPVASPIWSNMYSVRFKAPPSGLISQLCQHVSVTCQRSAVAAENLALQLCPDLLKAGRLPVDVELWLLSKQPVLVLTDRTFPGPSGQHNLEWIPPLRGPPDVHVVGGSPAVNNTSQHQSSFLALALVPTALCSDVGCDPFLSCCALVGL